MSKTLAANADHLDATSVPATAMAITLFGWFYVTSVSTFLRFLTLGSSSNGASYFSLALDMTGSTTQLAATSSKTGSLSQAKSSASPAANTWFHGIAVFASTADARCFLNGANKGTGTAVVPDTTVDHIYLSGRPTDHLFGIHGQAAHDGIAIRALSDAECAYLGTGGNPRALKNISNYWEVTATESPVVDQLGSINLTLTGTSAGTTNPNIETFMTGGPIGALNYTQNTAISSINLAAGGGIFDDVSSPFTVSLCQLNTPTSPTQTTATGTSVREIPVGSVSGLVADNYVKIAGNATPVRILAVNATALTILVDKDQTYANSATISYYTVNPLTIPGLGIGANVFSGIPTAASVNNLCFFRATNNNDSSIVADTDINTITVAASGGGGGGGGTNLLLVAGSYSGGFSGG